MSKYSSASSWPWRTPSTILENSLLNFSPDRLSSSSSSESSSSSSVSSNSSSSGVSGSKSISISITCSSIN
ncbi:MAG TPA: hypothetical protein DDW29_12880 [Gammaproteobacteria bacterium]|nr:hypothetical protein [Gammaproteobacteria bacterium]